MDFLDPKFGAWLDEQETEATRVNRAGDYRQRQAGELLRHINLARILVSRARNDDSQVDSSEMEPLVEKIKDLSPQDRQVGDG